MSIVAERPAPPISDRPAKKVLVVRRPTTPPTPARKAAPALGPDRNVRAIRRALGLSRADFGRFAGLSDRTIATVEKTGKAGGATLRRLSEARRLQEALRSIGSSREIGGWLHAPQRTLEGLKPLEVLERGEGDRIWRILHRVGAAELGSE